MITNTDLTFNVLQDFTAVDAFLKSGGFSLIQKRTRSEGCIRVDMLGMTYRWGYGNSRGKFEDFVDAMWMEIGTPVLITRKSNKAELGSYYDSSADLEVGKTYTVKGVRIGDTGVAAYLSNTNPKIVFPHYCLEPNPLENRIKQGTFVKLVAKNTKGWGNTWVDDMDNKIGYCFQVSSVSKYSKSISLKDVGYSWPIASFEVVTSEEYNNNRFKGQG